MELYEFLTQEKKRKKSNFMNLDSNIPENGPRDVDYQWPDVPKKRIALVFLIVLIGSFIFNLSIGEMLDNQVKTALTAIPNCSLGFSDLSYHLLPPKIVVNNPTIPDKCIGSTGHHLFLDKMELFFRGLSIVPFGPMILLSTKYKENEINLHVTLAPKEQVINIQDTNLDISTLPLPNGPLQNFSGKLNIRALLKIVKGNLQKTEMVIKSNNFKILPQTIGFFSIPFLNLQTLNLNGELQGTSKLVINSLTFGEAELSQLRGEVKGNIVFDPKNALKSSLDLEIEVKFTDEFREHLGFVENLIKGEGIRPDSGGFYSFKLRGILASPKVSP